MALLCDYRDVYAEGCAEVDRALARLTKIPAKKIDTFNRCWPMIEKRLTAGIDSCYFDPEGSDL